MPSTKKHRSARTKSRDTDTDDVTLIIDFNKKATIEVKRMKSDWESYLRNYEDRLDMSLMKIAHEIQAMKLKDILILERSDSLKDDDQDKVDEDKEYEEDSADASSPQLPRKGRSKRRITSDDGYGTATTEKTNRKVKKTVSKLQSATKIKFTGTAKRTSARLTKKNLPSTANLYAHTPRNQPVRQFEPITPKICPNTPINVLRRPRNGETVLSMEGSPLLVSTTLREENVANINLPLNNGTVISLLPNGDLRQSLIPNLSPSTINQLKTLKGYLEKFIPQ